MILWIIALLLCAALGLAGFYQGAIRVGFSFIGLIVAAVLAVPVAFIVKPILLIFGMEHPVLLGLISPFLAYALVLTGFKVGGLATHKKIDTYYKYKASDTVRLLWERMNSRVGIALGVANAFIYVILICVVVYVLGFFTIQAATHEKDSFVFKVINRLAEDMRSTRMDKAVAAYIPKADKYYDGADILALIFRNPILQNRLSTYPVFLTYSEKPEYRAIGSNTKFQEDWLKGPSLTEFRGNELMVPLVESTEMFTNTMAVLGGDLKDLKTYLETGLSPKYDDEKILGRWTYQYGASVLASRKKKPNMTLNEVKNLRANLEIFRDAMLTATLDHKLTLKLEAGPAKATLRGTWERKETGGYAVEVSEGNSSIEGEAHYLDGKLVMARGQTVMVFGK